MNNDGKETHKFFENSRHNYIEEGDEYKYSMQYTCIF